MLDSLNEHLKTATGPEVQASIIEACELFDEYELTDYETAYQDLLMTADNGELADTVGAICALTSQNQDEILRQMQVTLSEDVSIAQGNLILRTLRQMEQTELGADIAAVCREPGDSTEIFCQVLHILTGVAAEDFYPLIDSVGGGLIKRIATLASEQSEEEPEASDLDPLAMRRSLDRLTRFKYFVAGQSVQVYDDVLAGQAVGMPFVHYYDRLMDQLLQARKPPAEVATQLYGAAIIASDTQGNPTPVVLKALNRTFSSIDAITPIQVALQSLILKFQAHETSGVKQVN